MTEELKEKILLAETLVTVEDLYRPYRPKRRTRATIAKEKGLEPLAAYMMLQQAKEPLEETAKQYISEEKEVKTEEEAIAGAKDIIAEIISDNADYRTWIRKTTMKKGKVVLVGTGFVGMSMAYSMLNKGGVNELILIDIDKDKTIGEEMDLSHGLPFAPQKMVIKAGDYSDCKDAQVVVITAGIAQKPGQTRLELAEVNTKIMKQITESIMKSGFDGIIIVASNPVDLMTYVVAEVSGLPKNRVIGSGTVLDTARLRYLMADYLKISSKNIHAYIMGEHGDSSFVPWDHAYVGCKKVKDVMKDNNHPMEDLEKIHKGVVDAAYEIIEKKKATYYGIGMALSRLVKAVLDNENSILTVSTYLKDGQYGQDDIYIGVPAIINSNGVRELVELNLNETEQAKLNNSCKLIKEMRERSIEKIIKG